MPGWEPWYSAIASEMRSSVGTSSAPRRSSERKRAYPRSAAGEPARAPRKFGSCPPVARAPRSTGTEPSGAVRSSWIWNLLIGVFMGDGILYGDGMASVPPGALLWACCLLDVSVGPLQRPHKPLLPVLTHAPGCRLNAGGS